MLLIIKLARLFTFYWYNRSRWEQRSTRCASRERWLAAQHLTSAKNVRRYWRHLTTSSAQPSICSHISRRLARRLLVRAMPLLGGRTVLALATRAHALQFISNPTCLVRIVLFVATRIHFEKQLEILYIRGVQPVGLGPILGQWPIIFGPFRNNCVELGI